LLEIQKREVEGKNREVSVAKTALEEKAEQLQLTSRYKSQFLANMSHELRTPLNSLLILSKLLSENPDGNLTDKQREFAKTINAAGNDLLALINDILDLSKIESGTVSLEAGDVGFRDLADNLERTFRQIADERGLSFTLRLDPRLPRSVRTDGKRLQQVLRNLLSNAFKFTEQGGVTLQIGSAEGRPCGPGASGSPCRSPIRASASRRRSSASSSRPSSRRTAPPAGNTAARASACRSAGRSPVCSAARSWCRARRGAARPSPCSCRRAPPPLAPAARGRAGDGDGGPASGRNGRPRSPAPAPMALSAFGRPHAIVAGDHIVLIVEDDAMFASILLELAREQGFKGLIANDGASALAMAHRYKPHAVTLDLGLPDMDGWALLDLFKHDPRTRHLPVHVISIDEQKKRGLRAGAFGFLEKPVDRDALLDALTRTREFIDRPVKRLLLVEDDEVQRESLQALLGNGDVEVTAVGTAQGALESVEARRFDCVVVDLGLPDLDGTTLIERIRATKGGGDLPVVVYTGRDLSADEERQLQQLASTVIVKDSGSPERLLDETALFLHRTLADLPEERQIRVERVKDEASLRGRKVLVVDDDVRNIFSLTAALEQHGLEVVFAENGREGIERLRTTPGIDIMLVDIMMPEMDGYETMREIRKNDAFRNLPIVAVTAKAMKGDREKCLEAGATDYVSKPVDIDQLLAVLRVQLDGGAMPRPNGRGRAVPVGESAGRGS
jgi:CheY-like chemotaxis protein